MTKYLETNFIKNKSQEEKKPFTKNNKLNKLASN